MKILTEKYISQEIINAQIEKIYRCITPDENALRAGYRLELQGMLKLYFKMFGMEEFLEDMYVKHPWMEQLDYGNER